MMVNLLLFYPFKVTQIRVTFLIGASLDEPQVTYLASRRQIAAHLSYSTTWQLPAQISGCSVNAEFTQQLPSQLELTTDHKCDLS